MEYMSFVILPQKPPQKIFQPSWPTYHWAKQLLNVVKHRSVKLKYNDQLHYHTQCCNPRLKNRRRICKNCRACEHMPRGIHKQWRAVGFPLGLKIAAMQKEEEKHRNPNSSKNLRDDAAIVRAPQKFWNRPSCPSTVGDRRSMGAVGRELI